MTRNQKDKINAIERLCGREIWAMQSRPLQTRDLYGTQILCGNYRLFARVQDHLRDHHGLRAIPTEIECDAVNAAIGGASSNRSWEYICGNKAPEAQACWPKPIAVIGRVTIYTVAEWDQAVAAAAEMAENNPDFTPGEDESYID